MPITGSMFLQDTSLGTSQLGSSIFVASSMAETVVLKVGMSCEGCAGAVKRALTKMEGVESFDVDMKEQKVTVKGNVQPDAVLQAVSKTGKKTLFWEAEVKATEVKEAEVEVTEVREAEAKATEVKEAEGKTEEVKNVV
ncbi:copper transport protein ATX1-like [Tasmannia lanceolata]|uniref:copper transport protein ATX1-like n=1 Tax=Tasmannia lanceolata TaxID=3420 RepID=UPI004063255E